jgi:hypothetical protein
VVVAVWWETLALLPLRLLLLLLLLLLVVVGRELMKNTILR